MKSDFFYLLLRRLTLVEVVERHFEALCSQPEARWDLKQSCLLGKEDTILMVLNFTVITIN